MTIQRGLTCYTEAKIKAEYIGFISSKVCDTHLFVLKCIFPSSVILFKLNSLNLAIDPHITVPLLRILHCYNPALFREFVNVQFLHTEMFGLFSCLQDSPVLCRDFMCMSLLHLHV